MKKLITLFLLASLVSLSAIDFTVDFTGSPDEFDVRAAKLKIATLNAERAAEEPPLSPLPDGTNAEIKASYNNYMAGLVDSAHASHIRDAQQATLEEYKVLLKTASNAQIASAKADLTP